MSEFYDVGQDRKGVRDYRIAALEIAEFLAVVLLAAFLFRSFLFEPYSIPGYSMSSTLVPGDKILVNKFIYGPVIPFTHKHIFKLHSPIAGEVVLFRDPAIEERFSVKRIVGCPGAKIRITNKQALVDNVPFVFPLTAERGSAFLVDGKFSPRDNMPEFSVPKKGDYINIEQLGLSEFDFYASIIKQENPGVRITQTADLIINGKSSNNMDLSDFKSDLRRKDNSLNFDAMDWLMLKNVQNFIEARNDSMQCSFRRTLYMDGMKLREYIMKFDAYFLMGDNWDESLDGRFTGFITRDRIESRVSLVFWSRNEGGIRWRRLFIII